MIVCTSITSDQVFHFEDALENEWHIVINIAVMIHITCLKRFG